MNNPKNQKCFLDSWLDDSQFKDWLVKVKQIQELDVVFVI